ncbi:MAG: multicopy suppressor of ts gsp1 [Bathelium mastoideum]|nr:MAG: multicopy suppressor of ts gsp1 [Bathelium mastoideum]
MDTSKAIELFGGAITAQYPRTFIDVSNLRQVPDHQEVYVDSQGFTSIIVDILERPPEDVCSNDKEAALHHLKDITSDHDLAHTKIWHEGLARFPKLPSHFPAVSLLATEPDPIAEKATDKKYTSICLTLLRLEDKKTDILVTTNGHHEPGSWDNGNVNFETIKSDSVTRTMSAYHDKILATFEIKDWSLFVS